jgi:uncharacterized protein YndB with AHSA1/START domain
MDDCGLEIWINADPATVFRALTTREGLDAWWGTAVSAEPVAGSLVTFDHGLGAPLQFRITDLAPDRRLEWRCVSDFADPQIPAAEWLGHRLSFELRAARRRDAGPLLQGFLTAEAFTVLRFRQSGWASDARWRDFCTAAWGETLSVNLKRHCEAGGGAD